MTVAARAAVRRLLLFGASSLFLAYVLAPIAWMVSSSLQPETEITSVPPHWIPHAPTLENFRALKPADNSARE